MTTKADFSEDEWATLVRSPMVAGAAITVADPGGPIEVLKETSAVLKFATSTSSEQRDDLVGELAREVRGLAEQRKNPLGDFKPRGALAGKEIIDEISRAGEIVSAKASPRGGRRVPRLDHGVRAKGCRRREGGRIHGLPRRAREPRREGHARAAPIGAGRERRLSEARPLGGAHPLWSRRRRGQRDQLGDGDRVGYDRVASRPWPSGSCVSASRPMRA
jgi:hypothetical protein